MEEKCVQILILLHDNNNSGKKRRKNFFVKHRKIRWYQTPTLFIRLCLSFSFVVFFFFFFSLFQTMGANIKLHHTHPSFMLRFAIRRWTQNKMKKNKIKWKKKKKFWWIQSNEIETGKPIKLSGLTFASFSRANNLGKKEISLFLSVVVCCFSFVYIGQVIYVIRSWYEK